MVDELVKAELDIEERVKSLLEKGVIEFGTCEVRALLERIECLKVWEHVEPHKWHQFFWESQISEWMNEKTSWVERQIERFAELHEPVSVSYFRGMEDILSSLWRELYTDPNEERTYEGQVKKDQEDAIRWEEECAKAEKTPNPLEGAEGAQT